MLLFHEGLARRQLLKGPQGPGKYVEAFSPHSPEFPRQSSYLYSLFVEAPDPSP